MLQPGDGGAMSETFDPAICIRDHRGRVEPIALLRGTAPGMMCSACNCWSSLTREQFRKMFGSGFNRFCRDELKITTRRVICRDGDFDITEGPNFVAIEAVVRKA